MVAVFVPFTHKATQQTNGTEQVVKPNKPLNRESNARNVQQGVIERNTRNITATKTRTERHKPSLDPDPGDSSRGTSTSGILLSP